MYSLADELLLPASHKHNCPKPKSCVLLKIIFDYNHPPIDQILELPDFLLPSPVIPINKCIFPIRKIGKYRKNFERKSGVPPFMERFGKSPLQNTSLRRFLQRRSQESEAISWGKQFPQQGSGKSSDGTLESNHGCAWIQAPVLWAAAEAKRIQRFAWHTKQHMRQRNKNSGTKKIPFSV